MLNKAKIQKYLNVIRHATHLIEAELSNDGTMEEMDELIQTVENVKKPIQIAAPVETPIVETTIPPVEQLSEARQKHIQELMAIESWPKAIPDIHVKAPTDKDKKARAIAVMDMTLDRSIEGLKFLDFGCGEGWVAQEAKRRGAESSVGYDIHRNEKWKDVGGARFIHTLGPLKVHSFDVVMLYDVLDHCFDVDEVMSTVHSVVNENGVVYVRCHPWTSLHATHLYKQGINKAYMHLFLTWDEIKSLINEDPMFTRPEQNPLEAYRWWFRNFKIVKERVDRKPVDDFFKVDSFKKLLAAEQNLSDIDHFLKMMEIRFVDYILTPK